MFNTINCIYNYILLSFTTNLNFIRYVCSKRGDILLKRYVLIFALILLTIMLPPNRKALIEVKCCLI